MDWPFEHPRIVIAYLVVVLIVGANMWLVWRERRRANREMERELDRKMRGYVRLSRQIGSAIMYLAEERGTIAIGDVKKAAGPCCERCDRRIDRRFDALIELGWIAPEGGIRFRFNVNQTKYALTPEGRRVLNGFANRPMEDDPLVLPRSKVNFSHAAWHAASGSEEDQ